MTLESPWALLLLLPPALWIVLSWRREGYQGRLLAAAVPAVLMVLALSQPKLVVRQSRMAVTVLEDTSAGIAGWDLRRESEFLAGLEKARGKHVVRVIPFVETTRKTVDRERTEPWDLAPTPGPAGRGTDIETAVREGIATLPAGRVPRLVILSDGLENRGSAEHAVRQAQQFGIPIDTVPLAGRPQQKPRMDTEAAPSRILPALPLTCVVVVFETSRLMEGQKLELARLAALGLIENLRRTDLVGVLAFEDTFHWTIPIQNAREKDRLNQALDDLTASGGVRIGAALEEALRSVQPVNARFKHIVLFTDGISRDPAALALARQAAAQHVRISAISMGEELNRRYFASLAGFSGGRSLFLRDPAGLEEASMVGFDTVPIESRVLPVLQAIPPRDEPDTEDIDGSLLRWISKSTGGRFNPSPSSIFEPDGRTAVVFLQMWPALVIFALGWTLFEMIPRGRGETSRRLQIFPARHHPGHPSSGQSVLKHL